jgi:hypothetical protein
MPTPEMSRMEFSETVLFAEGRSQQQRERETWRENARLSTGDADAVGPLSWTLDTAVRRRSIAQTNELRVEHEVEGSVAGGVEGVLGDGDTGAGALWSLCLYQEVSERSKEREGKE